MSEYVRMNNEYLKVKVDVLVIGAGAAGLRAALAAHDRGREVVIVTKRARADAHTVMAAGGINAVLGTVDPEDTWERHFADTLQDGYFINNPLAVEIMAQEAPQALQELVEWGCKFARTNEGLLDQRFFGAHTYRRTCYAGDYTGREIINTLLKHIEQTSVKIQENVHITKLLIQGDHCFGALAIDSLTGERILYLADSTILAAGGYTRLWQMSTSRHAENVGDGIYLALQAGCEIADMEFVQFHPTGMTSPDHMAGTLVTEAVRGEGGRLHNQNGERFMSRYDLARMELSTRDQVALANYTEIMEGRGGPNGGVYLDITHLSEETILEKIPVVHRTFLEALGLDISKKPMEVSPTAHYTMGGVVVDPETLSTNVMGLFAVGEVTTGLHGANRLGGNSLTETLVFGKRAGESAAENSRTNGISSLPTRVFYASLDESDTLSIQGKDPSLLFNVLRDVMWTHCGVIRDGSGLQLGLEKVIELKEAINRSGVNPTEEGNLRLSSALDLKVAICVAVATIHAAIERRESRGAHRRSDYPFMDSNMRLSISLRQNDLGTLDVSSRQTPNMPERLRPWIKEDFDLDLRNRLLE